MTPDLSPSRRRQEMLGGAAVSDATSPKRTPLYDLHVRNGAKFTPFAGYDMPVQYAAGVLKEHRHTRAGAGLFDVSHMGQVLLRPKSARLEDAAMALEALVPVDVLGLTEGRQRYALFTNEAGGILDDLMIANRHDHLMLVVNAACKDADLAHLQANLSHLCEIELLEDRALIALQGPGAEPALATLAPDVGDMRFMDVRTLALLDADCVVSRSGYTGEDGFEISLPSSRAEEIAARLLDQDTVQPIGLGARDSLRLEAGLCLYGSDLDMEVTPVEGALEWAISKIRRKGGDRVGGFPGADVILSQLETGAERRRVGLLPDGRAPMRAGTTLFAAEADRSSVGRVSSGGFGPSVEGPVAMGYLPTPLSSVGTTVFGEVRGKRLPATVAELPFITPTYKRK